MGRQLISKIIALTAGISLLFIAYNHNQNNLYEINGEAYGTSWTIKSTKYIGDNHKDNIKKIISRIDYVASNYKEDSEIAQINTSDDRYHFISDDLFNILTIAKEVEYISDGFYNITLGKVSSNLGFSPDFGRELIHKKDKTFKLNERNKSVEKLSSNWFDLSSIAKGYAVQMLHEYLLQHKLDNHFIDIGGEIIINGNNNDNPWLIGIQNPLSLQNNASIVIEKNNIFLAIATSGEYRNFKADADGNKISHTINPNSLKSIEHNVLSATVVHEISATYADAYATAFNAMGADLAIETANKNNIALMLIVQNDNNLDIIYSKRWYDLVI